MRNTAQTLGVQEFGLLKVKGVAPRAGRHRALDPSPKQRLEAVWTDATCDKRTRLFAYDRT